MRNSLKWNLAYTECEECVEKQMLEVLVWEKLRLAGGLTATRQCMLNADGTRKEAVIIGTKKIWMNQI
jgi:hypothetical protein